MRFGSDVPDTSQATTAAHNGPDQKTCQRSTEPSTGLRNGPLDHRDYSTIASVVKKTFFGRSR
jgi:hypothetical protein